MPSPSCLCHRRLSHIFLTVNMTAWLVPFRITVGAAPAHNPRMPSSRIIVLAQCTGPLYLKSSRPNPFCCCNRIFTTYCCCRCNNSSKQRLLYFTYKHKEEKTLNSLAHSSFCSYSIVADAVDSQLQRRSLEFELWLWNPRTLHTDCSKRGGWRETAEIRTSKGVTMVRASSTPAPKPAVKRPTALILPVWGSVSADWSTALEPMRRVYLSVKCVANGVNPFHNARTPSCCTIVVPQFQIPL